MAGEEYNRSSDFFQREIRDYEYYAVLDFAFEALEYNDTVLINAPFAGISLLSFFVCPCP